MPRSEDRLVTLVVCLPCRHEGGQLVVRHQDRTTTFDWSRSRQNIRWAAFFSDCGHEVLEVTSGYKLTLTYNLRVRCLSQRTGLCKALDPKQLSMYKEAEEALARPDFMPDGKDNLLLAMQYTKSI
jgi:hypothetical protein